MLHHYSAWGVYGVFTQSLHNLYNAHYATPSPLHCYHCNTLDK